MAALVVVVAAGATFPSPLPGFRRFLRSCWGRLGALSGRPGATPALAVQGPPFVLEHVEEKTETAESPGFLDSVFWMAAPKSRRTIEVNRCRRRNPRNLIKLKRNIDVCPQCGNLKQKHILCGYCYEKVKQETIAIRKQMGILEGGPHKAPTVETIVLYEGEKPRDKDEGKRIIERNRKRPSWFTLD